MNSDASLMIKTLEKFRCGHQNFKFVHFMSSNQKVEASKGLCYSDLVANNGPDQNDTWLL